MIGRTASGGFLSGGAGIILAQSGIDPILHMMTDTSQPGEISAGQAYLQLEKMAAGVIAKRVKKDHQRILKLVFDQGRREFLHFYDKNYPHFSSLFTEGKYNCVTGTAMYAWVLLRLGYDIKIHETAFHAYLTIHTDKNVYLMDATDPVNGFVEGVVNVGKRELWYTGNELQKGLTFKKVITFRQLCGLQYYNQAVVHFNRRNYSSSIAFLQKAAELYPQSDRITSLMEAARSQNAEVVSYSPASMVVTAGNDPGSE